MTKKLCGYSIDEKERKGKSMKLERTKNASRNIIFGCIFKLYNIVIPFFMRTAMIYIMGVEYTGLNSLFTSILSVLNLAELGVGLAMVYSMYRPIAENDTKTICALMKLYRTYYRVIGLVIAAGGLLLLPFLPNLIEGSIPSGINLQTLYLLNLGATVLSYWLFAYKNSILSAHQRNDINTKISMIVTTVQYIFQFATLFFFHSYYLYLMVALFAQCLINIINAVIADKMYPQYKPMGRLDHQMIKTINGKVKDLFTVKIGAIIVDSADTIVISAFLGLTMLTKYQNYFYIMNSVRGFISVIFGSITAGIGNSIIVETREKNYGDLKKLTFIICWISCICACCFLNLYGPFMNIWVGEALQFDFGVIVCLVIYFYTQEINQVVNTYKDAAGMWHKDRFRPLVTALCNLILNLILVNVIGIYGILLSTIISTVFIGIPWLLQNLFYNLFDHKMLKPYLKQLLVYIFVATICCTITYQVCIHIVFNDWITLIVRGIISVLVPNVIMYVLLHRMNEFLEGIKLVDRILKGKVPVIAYMIAKHEK